MFPNNSYTKYISLFDRNEEDCTPVSAALVRRRHAVRRAPQTLLRDLRVDPLICCVERQLLRRLAARPARAARMRPPRREPDGSLTFLVQFPVLSKNLPIPLDQPQRHAAHGARRIFLLARDEASRPGPLRMNSCHATECSDQERARSSRTSTTTPSCLSERIWYATGQPLPSSSKSDEASLSYEINRTRPSRGDRSSTTRRTTTLS